MDSFYDAPRRPPAPITRDTLAAVPVVPEISVLCSSNGPRNAFTPYTQWRSQQTTAQPNYNGSNKENINASLCNTQNNSILKKQVRFESPKLHQRLSDNKIPNHNENVKIPNGISQNNVQQVKGRGMPSFEQMYMANIPNRQLDLSIINMPKESSETINSRNNRDHKTEAITKENIVSRTYKEFLENQKSEDKIVLNDSVTDIFNYKGNITNRNSLVPEATPLCKLKQFQDVNYDRANLDIYNKQSNQNSLASKEFANQKISPAAVENIFPNHSLKSTRAFYPQSSSKSRQFLAQAEDYVQTISSNMNSHIKTHRNMDKCTVSDVETNGDCEKYKGSDSVGCQEHIDKETTTFAYAPNQLKQCGCSVNLIDSAKHQVDSLKPKNEDDFSSKDLLKIIAQQSQQIAQQNNQLLLLQQQVSELISMQKNNEVYRQKSIGMGQNACACHYEKPVFPTKSDHCKRTGFGNNTDKYPFLHDQECSGGRQNLDTIQDRCITSTRHEVANRIEQKFSGTPKKNKNHVPNFSIGLTTSFEVSFKRPPYKNQNEFLQKNTRVQDLETEPLKIQEITENESIQNDRNCKDDVDEYRDKIGNENDNKETLVDTSIVFKEPICVREPCPSPEPSIKINMNDFDDSDSEDDTSEVEVSFYKNLMAQVNKILQKAQIETADEIAYNVASPSLNQKTLHKVKEATLKHLRKIGVDLPNFEDSSQNSSSSEETDGRSYDQDDISFAVKQLLMKYLPADHLAKLAAREDSRGDRAILTPKEKIGPIRNRPEFSFATVQYMKKYNLITNGQRGHNQLQNTNPTQSPKILDITKLKQQPKFL